MFVAEPGFARRLYSTPAVVRQAAQETLKELRRPKLEGQGTSSRPCRLTFRHSCLCAHQLVRCLPALAFTR